MPQWIIYTDLDGTLLDFYTYSYKKVEDTVKKINERQIPLIFCSSKTRVEQEVYRQNLNLDHPFITENGSAIFIPKDYFDTDFSTFSDDFRIQKKSNYTVLELGEESIYIKKIIEEGRARTNCKVKGYADLTLDEITNLTHLSHEAAMLAATREYSETLLTGDFSSSNFKDFQQYLSEHGLACVSGGKFYTVMGNRSNKGEAIRILNKFFRKKYSAITTVGLGDSANDIPLLEAVNVPFLVKKPHDDWQSISNANIFKVAGIGPEGWNMAIESILRS